MMSLANVDQLTYSVGQQKVRDLEAMNHAIAALQLCQTFGSLPSVL